MAGVKRAPQVFRAAAFNGFDAVTPVQITRQPEAKNAYQNRPRCGGTNR